MKFKTVYLCIVRTAIAQKLHVFDDLTTYQKLQITDYR